MSGLAGIGLSRTRVKVLFCQFQYPTTTRKMGKYHMKHLLLYLHYIVFSKYFYKGCEGCENTMLVLSDLVQFLSSQVRNFYAIFLSLKPLLTKEDYM